MIVTIVPFLVTHPFRQQTRDLQHQVSTLTDQLKNEVDAHKGTTAALTQCVRSLICWTVVTC